MPNDRAKAKVSRCAVCRTTKLKRVVCDVCHEKAIKKLGQKIVQLQGKVLSEETTNDLLGLIVAAKCTGSHVKNSEHKAVSALAVA